MSSTFELFTFMEIQREDILPLLGEQIRAALPPISAEAQTTVGLILAPVVEGFEDYVVTGEIANTVGACYEILAPFLLNANRRFLGLSLIPHLFAAITAVRLIETQADPDQNKDGAWLEGCLNKLYDDVTEVNNQVVAILRKTGRSAPPNRSQALQQANEYFSADLAIFWPET